MKTLFAILALLLALGTAQAMAEPEAKLDPAIVQLQHDWARVNYQVGKDAQEAAFKALADQAHQVTANSLNQAEAMIWEAIVLSGYAKAKGGLGALKYAEKARDLLFAAEKLNPQAL